MKASYSSSITFTGGRLADRPLVNYEVFSMYTAGLQGLVRGLALGVKPLRVNLVSPGATMTEMVSLILSFGCISKAGWWVRHADSWILVGSRRSEGDDCEEGGRDGVVGESGECGGGCGGVYLFNEGLQCNGVYCEE